MTQRPNLNLAKIVLRELKLQPLYRKELEKRVVQKAGSHAMFENIFRWLVQNGHIQKSSSKFRAKYVLTEKGAKFLELV